MSVTTAYEPGGAGRAETPLGLARQSWFHERRWLATALSPMAPSPAPRRKGLWRRQGQLQWLPPVARSGFTAACASHAVLDETREIHHRCNGQRAFRHQAGANRSTPFRPSRFPPLMGLVRVPKAPLKRRGSSPSNASLRVTPSMFGCLSGTFGDLGSEECDDVHQLLVRHILERRVLHMQLLGQDRRNDLHIIGGPLLTHALDGAGAVLDEVRMQRGNKRLTDLMARALWPSGGIA